MNMNISIYSGSELTITATPHDDSTAWISIKEGDNSLDIFIDPRNLKKLRDLKAAVDKLIEAYPAQTPEPEPPDFVPSQATREAIDDITADNGEHDSSELEGDDVPF